MSVLLSFLPTLRTWARSRAALQLEILALRHQLQVLQRTRPQRLRLTNADRWLWAVLPETPSAPWRTQSCDVSVVDTDLRPDGKGHHLSARDGGTAWAHKGRTTREDHSGR